MSLIIDNIIAISILLISFLTRIHNILISNPRWKIYYLISKLKDFVTFIFLEEVVHI